MMVNAGQHDHAKALTLRIPESSPSRGQSELVTGQAIWGKRVQRQGRSTEHSPFAVGVSVATGDRLNPKG